MRNEKGQFIKGNKPIKPFNGKERLGKKNSKHQKEAISLALTGKKLSEQHKYKLRKAKLGKKLSEEHRRKIGDAHRGNKSSFWKGGVTQKNASLRSSIDFKLWRESVYKRDNYTCKRCLVVGEKLNPHHIKPFAQYPELRFTIDNGIVLCKECHKMFHKIYGRKNNNKEQINNFIKNA